MAVTMPGRSTHTDADAGQQTASTTEETFETISATAPEGWRVELVEGAIYVVPPANGEHEEFVSEVTGQVRDQRKELARYTGLGLIFRTDEFSADRLIPDLVVAPKGSFADDLEYHDPGPVLMVGLDTGEF